MRAGLGSWVLGDQGPSVVGAHGGRVRNGPHRREGRIASHRDGMSISSGNFSTLRHNGKVLYVAVGELMSEYAADSPYRPCAALLSRALGCAALFLCPARRSRARRARRETSGEGDGLDIAETKFRPGASALVARRTGFFLTVRWLWCSLVVMRFSMRSRCRRCTRCNRRSHLQSTMGRHLTCPLGGSGFTHYFIFSSPSSPRSPPLVPQFHSGPSGPCQPKVPCGLT